MSHSPGFRYSCWIISSLIFLLIILSLALIEGCSSFPKARYYKATGDVYADKKGLLPFALQGALVTIAPKPALEQTKGEKGKQPEKQLAALGLTQDQRGPVGGIQGLRDAQAFATQMDAADSLYFLEPHDSFLTQSNISVTYYDGHHRIKTIGTEFQDNRIKVIEAVGGIITTIIPFVGIAPPTTKEDNIELPLVFDFASLDRFEVHDTYSNWENIPNHTKWWYRYKISQPQGRVFKTEAYFKKREGKYTREFPISACVDLTLEIGKGSNSNEAENTRATYVVSVPDPSFVEPLPFPRKGSIAMHTVCGADITTQPSQTADTFSILESIAKQVEAIWKAQPKKAEEEAPKKSP